MMPGMDGFEVAIAIRGRERTRNTRIVFVTAIARELYPQSALAGLNSLSITPFGRQRRNSELSFVIRTANLSARRSGTEARRFWERFVAGVPGMARAGLQHGALDQPSG